MGLSFWRAFLPNPSYLYKYESFTTQSLLNLKEQVLFFGSPLNFNDPYDSALRAFIEDSSDEDVERIREYYLNSAEASTEEKSKIAQISIAELRVNFVRGGYLALEEIVQDFLKKRGVTCFSESNDNLLLWSHYGGRYKGFCLEFSTSHSLFENIFQVNYEKEFPKIGLSRLLTEHRDTDLIKKLFCTKSEAWRYEREWRAIHQEAGTKFHYPSECLTGVYFGPDIDEQSLEIICLILQGQNESIKFWRGTRSKVEFKVNFEQIGYRSFLEAKRLGLR